ncbi:nucleotidyltransferase-like protein [Paenibacillus lemnae]|uniref:Nucleotidyltransferase-like domain-containing protein n=1 Tax=Paenibacillus lemnae TaxID=1330551 RepID=A0A848MAX3_PAELE|nr:hypothetical protein [Paenibacillus lemnae]
MELANFSLYYNNSVDAKALGAVVYRNRTAGFSGSLAHDFELNLLVVYEGEMTEPEVQHIHVLGERCQMFNLSIDELQHELITAENHMILKCIMDGSLIKDTEGKLSELRREFLTFGGSLREQKLFVGFARFLRHYVDAKTHLKNKHVLDAFLSMMEGLQQWARIELIQRGIHPEDAVWEQMSGLNTPVRKLYEELTDSSETLAQRIELALLACEFSVISKMAEYSQPLMRILRSRKLPWSIQELMQHPMMEQVSTELPLVLRKLVYRSLIHEAVGWKEAHRTGSEHIRYLAN